MKSSSEKASIYGAQDGDDFAATHPATGNEVFGAYVVWSASTMEGGKANYKKTNSPDQAHHRARQTILHQDRLEKLENPSRGLRVHQPVGLVLTHIRKMT